MKKFLFESKIATFVHWEFWTFWNLQNLNQVQVSFHDMQEKFTHTRKVGPRTQDSMVRR